MPGQHYPVVWRDPQRLSRNHAVLEESNIRHAAPLRRGAAVDVIGSEQIGELHVMVDQTLEARRLAPPVEGVLGALWDYVSNLRLCSLGGWRGTATR